MLKNLNFLKRIFGSTNDRKISSLQPIIAKINDFEITFEKLSDIDLKNKTDQFKQRLRNNETIDQILPEAFAVVKETARRWKEIGELVVTAEDFDNAIAAERNHVKIEGGKHTGRTDGMLPETRLNGTCCTTMCS